LPTARLKRLQAAVRRYVLDRSMVPADGRILVAVSGGPDSTALLVLLARLRKSLKLSLHVAHYDHGLRSRRTAQREERFVRELAASLDVSITVGHGEVASMAKEQKLSLEDAARRRRYAFLAETAVQTRCGAVATGHTAADQAETVIMHIVRGSGLAGLAGMAPVSPWPFPSHRDLRLIRPLLRLEREDTLAVCEDAGLVPLEDRSNVSTRFRRNRVRHEVMPLLRTFNPRVDDALVRLADTAADDYAFIARHAERLVRRSGDGAVRLPRSRLLAVPSSLRRHALRVALGRAGGGLEDVAERHLVALDRLLQEGKTGDRLDLPGDVTAELRREDLLLAPGRAEAPGLPLGEAQLEVPGCGRLGPLMVAAGRSPPSDAVTAEVDAECLGSRVTVRRRRAGDRFQPLGMNAPKELQDFFVDEHVPRVERDRVPLFECERGIAWVGGLRIAEWAKPRPGEPVLFLSYESHLPQKE
jgi:tRNA(Ile)-lysidine synthase